MTEYWDDLGELTSIATELGHRKRQSATRSRERVIERIKELGGEVPALPDGAALGTDPALRARIFQLEAQVVELQQQLADKEQALRALQQGGLFSQPG